MSTTPLRVAIGVAAIVTSLKVVRAARVWVDSTLAQIDEALCRIGDDRDDQDDDEDEPAEEDREEFKAQVVRHGDDVTRVAELTMGGGLHNGKFGILPVAIRLTFDETDPVAVVMEITLNVEVNGIVGRDSQAWAFARDILDTALSHTDGRLVGEGDFQAQYMPGEDEVWVWLTHMDGRKIRLDLPAGPVKNFMAASFVLVPADAEVNIDAELSRLLGGDQ